jgi:penicillin V acylase-like amidase (Ntn superfamily)
MEAFISSNKIYLEIEKKQDNFLSKILTKLTEKPSKFIAGYAYWEQYSLVVYGFYGVFTDESDRFVRISLFLTY